MHPNLAELLDLVAAKLSLEEVLDILGWEERELLEHIGEHINEHYEDFLEATE